MNSWETNSIPTVALINREYRQLHAEFKDGVIRVISGDWVAEITPHKTVGVNIRIFSKFARESVSAVESYLEAGRRLMLFVHEFLAGVENVRFSDE